MKDSVTIQDNRTGKVYEIALSNGALPATELRKIKMNEEDFGLLSYDPAYKNTASCRSAITYIDGEQGILRYRGYPIEELAQESSFLEVAYLLIHGERPTQSQLKDWREDVMKRAMLHENTKRFMDGFHHDAHPMGILIGTVAALSTFYPEARKIDDKENRLIQAQRLIAKMPTIAAYSLRHRKGWPYVYPDERLSFCGNFLNMLFKRCELKYEPNPVLERALDVLFILHADHEQNCSATTMRVIGSAQADPYVATAGAGAALYGPLHGGANERVLQQLRQISSKDNVAAFIKRVKKGEAKLMGFGHRVYKNYDPRARIVQRVAEEVFEETQRNPLIDIAVELERIALEDEYFVTRKLYPNVDFYSGIIYEAMGFPTDAFTVLFAIARTAGWVAQWMEMLNDDEQNIARPRQIYVGQPERSYIATG